MKRKNILKESDLNNNETKQKNSPEIIISASRNLKEADRANLNGGGFLTNVN